MDSPESKMRNSDRVLVLSVMEGKKPLSTIGVADPRLFTGENKLHGVMDTQTSLWYLKYDMGVIPPPLQGRFTSFAALKKHADAYFFHRNMEIKEVID
jgi:hypothetical protein